MRRAFLLATWLAASVVAAPAGAQDGAVPSSADASARFDRGATFYREGDYAAALIEFKRAYELSPNWQVLFNIGQSYFQLRDYANALVTLQRFASEGGDRIAKEDRMTLDSELPDLAGRVGRVAIVSNLAGATVSVDDQPVGTTPLRDPLLVNAGSRQISAAYDGRTPVSQRVAMGGGDNVVVRLNFPPVAPSPVPAPGVSHTDRQVAQPLTGAPAVVSFLVAAGGVAVGSVFAIRAMNDKASLDRACAPGGACPASSQPDINALMRDSTFSTVGFGAGIACFVAGIAFWAASRAPSAAAESSTRSVPRGAAHGEAPAIRLRLAPGVVAGTF
jgi:hypothetical protein